MLFRLRVNEPDGYFKETGAPVMGNQKGRVGFAGREVKLDARAVASTA
ncbi:MAG TPA: hypothetical protein VGB17_15565 [Pyrinomonadaceae bacterium]